MLAVFIVCKVKKHTTHVTASSLYCQKFVGSFVITNLIVKVLI
jgi:hypothetical protein